MKWAYCLICGFVVSFGVASACVGEEPHSPVKTIEDFQPLLDALGRAADLESWEKACAEISDALEQECEQRHFKMVAAVAEKSRQLSRQTQDIAGPVAYFGWMRFSDWCSIEKLPPESQAAFLKGYRAYQSAKRYLAEHDADKCLESAKEAKAALKQALGEQSGFYAASCFLCLQALGTSSERSDEDIVAITDRLLEPVGKKRTIDHAHIYCLQAVILRKSNEFDREQQKLQAAIDIYHELDPHAEQLAESMYYHAMIWCKKREANRAMSELDAIRSFYSKARHPSTDIYALTLIAEASILIDSERISSADFILDELEGEFGRKAANFSNRVKIRYCELRMTTKTKLEKLDEVLKCRKLIDELVKDNPSSCTSIMQNAKP